MANAGFATVQIIPSARGISSQFQSQLSSEAGAAGAQAGEAMGQGLLGRMGSAASAAIKLVGTAAVTAAGAAAVSILKTGVEYNNLEQKSRAAFTTILGSSEAAASMMEKIAAFGKTSPFPRQAFISATQQLLGFGFEADKIIPTLTVINDAVAAIGGGSEEIATITDVFAKIQSQGKITGEELNRLGAVGINAVDLLAEHAGVSGNEIRDQISAGSIDAATAIDVLTTGMGTKFAGASENVKNTWGGAVDRVKGAWRDLSSALVEPFISKAGGGMAVEWANKLADKLRVLEAATPAFVANMTAVVNLLRTGDFTGGIFGLEEDSKVVDWLLRARDGALGLRDAAVGVYDVGRLLFAGDFTRPIFGQQEDSKLVDILFRIREGITGTYQLLVNADFTGEFSRAFGVAEDSPIVGKLLEVRQSVLDLVATFQGVDVSSFPAAMTSVSASGDGVADTFTKILDSTSGVGSSLAGVGTALGELGSGGGVIASNLLDALAGSMGFFADHTTLASAAILGFIGSMAASGPITQAYQVAIIVRTPLIAAQTVVSALNTRALTANTAATLGNNAAQNAGMFPLTRKTAAWVGHRIAVMASTVADGAALITGRAMIALQNASTAAGVRGTVARYAHAAATGVLGAATATAGAATAAFNAVLAGNPIALVVLAVAALVAGLVWFFTQTDIGKAIVTAAWSGIKAAAGAVVDWFTGTAWPMLQAVWAGIAAGATWLWQTVLAPAWAAISAGFEMAVGFISAAWSNVLSPVFQLVGAIAMWLWQSVLAVAFAGIQLGWDLLVMGAKWGWDNVLSPTFAAVAAIALWLWDSVLKPTWEAAKLGFDLLVMGAKWAWDNVLSPTFSALGSAASFLWNSVLAPTFGFISDRWDALLRGMQVIWDTILSPVFSALGDAAAGAKGAFETGVSGIKTAWDGLIEIAKAPVRFVVDTVINNGLIDNFNKLAAFFGTDQIPRVPLPAGFATGGQIPGSSPTSTADNIPIWATAGEFMQPVSTVAHYGRGVMEAMRTRSIPREVFTGAKGLAGGGIVDWVKDHASSAAGGVTSFLAEGADVVANLAGTVYDLATDPVGYLRTQVEKLYAQIGSSQLAQTVAGVPKKILATVLEKVQGLVDFGGGSLAGGGFDAAGGNYGPPGNGGLAANAAAARAFVMESFGLNNIGGYAARNIAGTGTISDHALGKAIDVMIPGWTNPSGVAKGNQVANWFTGNPDTYGTKYVIWRDQINSGGGWAPYTHPSGNRANPTLAHRDHVHVSLFDDGGYLQPGLNQVWNGTGSPEPLMNLDKPRQLDGDEAVFGGGPLFLTGRLELPGIGLVELVDARLERATSQRRTESSRKLAELGVRRG